MIHISNEDSIILYCLEDITILFLKLLKKPTKPANLPTIGVNFHPNGTSPSDFNDNLPYKFKEACLILLV
jgi:hypothetical protein